jgi:hypothetical protein
VAAAILILFFGGLTMILHARGAALLDARISLWVGHSFFGKRLRRKWGTHAEFKKFLTSKKILAVYRFAGVVAILIAIGLMVFLVSISH